MGEAIISRGGGSSGSGGGTRTLKTEIINQSTTWVVPKAINNEFHVRIFGGGGGAEQYRGGCGGMMNNETLVLTPGIPIHIQIGVGGKGYGSTESSNYCGGTTSFGTFLSALGGNSLYGGSGGGAMSSAGSNGRQFGGGGGLLEEIRYGNYSAGSGGYWGGGGGYIYKDSLNTIAPLVNGGCIYFENGNIDSNNLSGFGGHTAYTTSNINFKWDNSDIINATNGTNTIGYTNVFDGVNVVDISEDMCSGNLQGAGITYNNGYDRMGNNALGVHGAGGYGGNGGTYGGGGGGYGADGGMYFGGGGGYGGKGGSGLYEYSSGSKYARSAGGGGGYGPLGYGGSGGSNSNMIGKDGGIAAGGGSSYTGSDNSGNGGNGICIIQYYTTE